MKKTTKIISIALSLCFVLILGIVGVLAVPNINLEIGGNISFSAEGVKATILQGRMTKGTLSDGSTQSSSIMKQVSITTTQTQSELETAVSNANWHDLDLVFNTSGQAEISFSIRNDSSSVLYISISEETGTQSTSNNVTITTTGSTQIAAGQTSAYKVAFKTANTEMDAGLEAFKITFNLSLTQA